MLFDQWEEVKEKERKKEEKEESENVCQSLRRPGIF